MHRLYHPDIVFPELKCERQPHVVVGDDIHSWPVEAEVGIDDIDGRDTETEVSAVDSETHGTTRVQTHGLIVMHPFRVVAGHRSHRHRIADAAFDEGTDGGVR